MLTIGQITYANCTPIFHELLKEFPTDRYRLERGVPAVLNERLRQGEVDLCPSSSIEYGRRAERYYLLPDLSISAIGPVKSVLLFSRLPIEALAGHTIGLTSESETSVVLLRILLEKYHGVTASFERTNGLDLDRYPACLLIGDAALKAASAQRDVHCFDLGALWYAATGLPFVFALWIVRREAVEQHRDELRCLLADLLAAKQRALGSYEEIAENSQESTWMDRKELVDYWRTISYDLTPAHRQGVARFFQDAAELGILPAAPELRFVT